MKSSYNLHGSRFHSLFRGYGPEILTLGFYDLGPNDGARKSSSSVASPSSLSSAFRRG